MSDQRRVVVLLGAGGTLGGAIARKLASEADTDLVLGDVSDAALTATVDSIHNDSSHNGGSHNGGGHNGGVQNGGTNLATAVADVSELEQVEAIVRLAVARFGRLDVLISNAGVLAPNGRIHNLSTADWERSFRINVLGSVNAINAAVGPMRRQGSGSIILTASVAGLTAWTHAAPYCVTKAGVIHLAKVAAVEYARDGIRVNAVCPGTFLSAMHKELSQEAVDAIAAKHPLGLGSADDLVGAYSYLAGDASRWTTGTAIVVDGGYAAP
jgi:3-oxoacyl-[acyl-carrier protein] reductase